MKTSVHSKTQHHNLAKVGVEGSTISLENQAKGADELSVCNAVSPKGEASQPLHPLHENRENRYKGFEPSTNQNVGFDDKPRKWRRRGKQSASTPSPALLRLDC